MKGVCFLIMVFLQLTINGLSFAYMQSEAETTTLKIAHFGPGTPPYSWWGHISLIPLVRSLIPVYNYLFELTSFPSKPRSFGFEPR